MAKNSTFWDTVKGAGIGGLIGAVTGGGPAGALAGAYTGGTIAYNNSSPNRAPAQKSDKNSSYSKAWDNTIGRDGIAGWIGEQTGAWESAAQKRKFNKERRAIDLDIENLRSNNELVKSNMWDNYNYSSTAKQKQVGGLLSGVNSMGNVATDTSRYQRGVEAITASIDNQNKDFSNTVIRGMDRDRVTEDSVSAKELVRNQIGA